MKRVLLTGATGVLGTEIIHQILKNYPDCKIYVVIRDQDPALPFFFAKLHKRVSGIFSADVRDLDEMKRVVVEARPNIIFHLAAMTQVVDTTYIPHIAYETNVMGTVNLIEASKIIGNPAMVVASSDKAYGKVMWPASEESCINPSHPYDTSKACGDLIAHTYALHEDRKIVITRCGNIYGPGDVNWQRLIPHIIYSALRGENIVLRSNGNQVREYNYVNDIARAYMGLAEALLDNNPKVEKGHVFNISDGNSRHSALEIIEIAENCLPCVIPKVERLGMADDEGEKIALNSLKISQCIGWHPRIGLPDGLKMTFAWMQSYLDWRYHEID